MSVRTWLTAQLNSWLTSMRDAFRRQPIFGTILAALTLVGFAMIPLAIRQSLQDRDLERKRQESFSYNAQLDSLNSVQRNLANLASFIELQKQRLQQSEYLVNTLRAEQEKLEPVVATNRQVIEAILDLQSQKAKADVWWERGYGFASGILASIIAALLISFFARRKTTH